MVLELLEKHGELTTIQLAMITDKPVFEVEKEIERLWQQGKVCMDKDGVCYIAPKTTFPTMLLVSFLLFICSFVLVGAIKATF